MQFFVVITLVQVVGFWGFFFVVVGFLFWFFLCGGWCFLLVFCCCCLVGVFYSIRTRIKHLRSHQPVTVIQHGDSSWEQTEEGPDQDNSFSHQKLQEQMGWLIPVTKSPQLQRLSSGLLSVFFFLDLRVQNALY